MNGANIKSVTALEVLDSRGNPTVKVTVTTEGGQIGEAMVPSGASTGQYEAYELRDGDSFRYRGKGVLKAVSHVEGSLFSAVAGLDVRNQEQIDSLLCAVDGTENKENMGANAILGLSMAVARAGAAVKGETLWEHLSGEKRYRMPVPMMNILNGGAHSDNPLDIQEFMIVPVGADSFSEALRMGAEIYHTLGRELKKQGFSVGVGDEGGFAPAVPDTESALSFIQNAINNAGYSLAEVKISLDIAASEWWQETGYHMPKSKKEYTADTWREELKRLQGIYGFLSVEDPFGDTDMAGFRAFTADVGENCLVVGDDLFVTNTKRLEMGIRHGAANAILIKPNQIGTVSETLRVIDLARKNGYAYIISHRSGDTEDSFIADLAVATAAPLIKTGAPCRSERVAKYNRLLAIERTLGKSVAFGL